ncbi:conserved hypothetical protein [Trichinella spiralis]|uniref:hypothetical protein n=1 Tax=Trichinella spiralis TaxID=6334 RepID=UPI0001EFB5FB|nr:conserved hypothetical protein [Trichinella spiralis]
MVNKWIGRKFAHFLTNRTVSPAYETSFAQMHNGIRSFRKLRNTTNTGEVSKYLLDNICVLADRWDAPNERQQKPSNARKYLGVNTSTDYQDEASGREKSYLPSVLC